MRGLPRRRASTAWPSALLSLWAPVCSRSSRLRYTRFPGRKRSASVSGVGRPAYSRPSASSSSRERRIVRRLAPRGLELVQRGDERLGDEAAAVLAEPASAHAAGRLDECAHALVILDSRRRLEARARVDGPRPDGGDRLARRSRDRGRRRASAAPRPSARDRGASRRRPPTAGRSPSRRALPSREQHGVAAADSAFLVLVELDEVGAVAVLLADEHGDGERGVAHVEH